MISIALIYEFGDAFIPPPTKEELNQPMIATQYLNQYGNQLKDNAVKAHKYLYNHEPVYRDLARKSTNLYNNTIRLGHNLSDVASRPALYGASYGIEKLAPVLTQTKGSPYYGQDPGEVYDQLMTMVKSNPAAKQSLLDMVSGMDVSEHPELAAKAAIKAISKLVSRVSKFANDRTEDDDEINDELERHAALIDKAGKNPRPNSINVGKALTLAAMDSVPGNLSDQTRDHLKQSVEDALNGQVSGVVEAGKQLGVGVGSKALDNVFGQANIKLSDESKGQVLKNLGDVISGKQITDDAGNRQLVRDIGGQVLDNALDQTQIELTDKSKDQVLKDVGDVATGQKIVLDQPNKQLAGELVDQTLKQVPGVNLSDPIKSAIQDGNIPKKPNLDIDQVQPDGTKLIPFDNSQSDLALNINPKNGYPLSADNDYTNFGFA